MPIPESIQRTEDTLIANVLLSDDPQGEWAQARQALGPITHLTQRTHIVVAGVCDLLMQEGTPPSAQNVAAELRQVSWQRVVDTVNKLRKYDRVGALGRLTMGHQLEVVMSWRDPSVNEASSAFAELGGYTFATDMLSRGTSTLGKDPQKLAAVLRHHAEARRVAQTIEQIGESLNLDTDRPDPSQALQMVLAEIENLEQGQKPVAIGDAIKALANNDTGDTYDAIARFGLTSLDAALCLHAGSLLTISGVPGGGKTSLTPHIAGATAALHDYAPGTVLVISAEMDVGEVASIYASQASGATRRAVLTGVVNQSQREAMLDHGARLGSSVVVDDDTDQFDLPAVVNRIQTFHRRNPNLRCVIVDHIGLMDEESANQEERQKIAAITRRFKRMAKRLGIVIVELCQLTKSGTEQRRGKSFGSVSGVDRPRIGDLYGSKAIENDSNAVVLLWPRDQIDDHTKQVTAIIAKNRIGSLADIDLTFHGPSQRFSE